MNTEKKYYKYVEDVLNNKITHCDSVHKACLRFREDLKKQNTKDFPYTFSEEKADRMIAFIETLKFSEQDFLDKNFILDNWQSFIVANIFGWVDQHGNRRFKKALVFVARGNGKSPLASAIALANMMVENAGQVYAISTNYTQSAIIYNYMKNFINKDETLQQIFKIYAHSIENTIKSSYFRPLSSKFRGFDGFNPSFVIADEVAAMSDYSLLNMFTTALHKRKNSFLLMITTANYTNDNAPGVVEYNYSKNILNGIIKDEEYFTIIFEAEHDNPSDKTCYKKANPASFVDTEKLYKLFLESKNKKQMYDSFLTKNLNVFVLGAVNEFVDIKKINKIKENYEKYKDEITEEILQNSYCSVGADFSNRRDLTSITFSFYVEKLNKVYQEHFIFTTQYERPDTIANLYNLFIKQGHLFMCEGEYIDREFVLRVILTNIKKYKLQKEKVYFYYDEFGAIDYVTILDNFVTCVPVRQNLISISEHTKNYEELLFNNEMIISNNDVFFWCLQNARKYESNNLIKIQKENKDSELKIDAAISSLLSAIGIKQYLNTIQKNNIIGNITTDNLINVYKSLYKL